MNLVLSKLSLLSAYTSHANFRYSERHTVVHTGFDLDDALLKHG